MKNILLILLVLPLLLGCEVKIDSDEANNNDNSDNSDNSINSMPPEEEDTNAVAGLVFRYPSAEQLKAIDEGGEQ